MKKKPEAIVALLKDHGIRCPSLWEIVSENGNFLHVKNWFTGENRVIRK